MQASSRTGHKPTISVFGLIIITFFTCIVGRPAYKGYKQSVLRSPYECAAYKLQLNGFQEGNCIVTAQEQQEALLKIFHLAGLFHAGNLWTTLVHMNFSNRPELFKSIMQVMVQTNAVDEDPTRCNYKKLRKNLFKGTTVTEMDVIDFLLYLGQSAFGRRADEERYEKSHQTWMSSYSCLYQEAAARLGMIKRILPKAQHYYEAWITGASREGLLTRLIDFKQALTYRSISIDGDIFILTGQRPLWAELDGIGTVMLSRLEEAMQSGRNLDNLPIPLENIAERIEEGKNYMLQLAKDNHITLNPSSPFMVYAKDKGGPSPLFLPNRTYPNYAAWDKGMLTEATMSKDLVARYMDIKMQIIDTPAENDKRPDTESTIKIISQRLVQKIQQGTPDGAQKLFKIYFQSNQPYVQRQTLIAQRIINKALQENGLRDIQIEIDGVGFESKSPVTIVHSEVGALLNEKYRSADVHSSRDIKTLQYRTRTKEIVTEEMPDYSTLPHHSTMQFFQDFFDRMVA